jgi:hypothetical protein
LPVRTWVSIGIIQETGIFNNSELIQSHAIRLMEFCHNTIQYNQFYTPIATPRSIFFFWIRL